jgi:hypothetical protein
MNVKELRNYLSTLSDDMEITVSAGYGTLLDVKEVHTTITRSHGEVPEDEHVVVIHPIFMSHAEEMEEGYD